MRRLLAVLALAVTPVVAQDLVPPHGDDPAAYRLRRGDVVELKFFYDTDLSEQLQIAPDGRVSLPLVGQMDAAGRSVAEFQQSVYDAYAEFRKDPEVTVIVREYASLPVYVSGEVNRPGLVDFRPGMDFLGALSAAGGPTRAARLRKVLVIRKGTDGEPGVLEVNLRRQLRGNFQGALDLQPYDVVFVPDTLITRVDDFVDNYIRQVLPVNVSLLFDLDDDDGSSTRDTARAVSP